MKLLNTLNKKRNEAGFTLVELMVVVAIIGILAAIAIPNYQKYQAKARQSEAKLALGGMHTALTSYAAENTTFTACLNAAGYNPQAAGGVGNIRTYYATGFEVAMTTAAAACGPTGAGACTFYTWAPGGAGVNGCTGAAGAFAAAAGDNQTNWAATFSARAGTAAAANAQLLLITPATAISNTAFVAGAAGNVSSTNNTYDNWTIDQNKNMQNVQPNL